MFDNFLKLYALFKKQNVENPLDETLKAFNIFSNDLIRKIDQSLIEKNQCNLEDIVAKRKSGTPIEYAVGLGCFFNQTFISYTFYSV